MDTPDFSSMMADKPNPVEDANQRMAADRQSWYMKNMVGDEKAPGAIPLLSARIDQMRNPLEQMKQRGRMNVAIQQQFSGAKTLRDRALSETTGSGVGREAMRLQFSGLKAAREQGATGLQTKMLAQQERARTGFAKIGEGMQDSIVAGYGNLADLEANAAANRLRMAETAANRSLENQAGWLGMGAGLLGGVSAAIPYGYDPKTKEYSAARLGKGLGYGLLGGDVARIYSSGKDS